MAIGDGKARLSLLIMRLPGLVTRGSPDLLHRKSTSKTQTHPRGLVLLLSPSEKQLPGALVG